MSIPKFIHKNLNSFKRDKWKRNTIKQILNTPQKNNGVVNINRIDSNNIGDYYSAPALYFNILIENKLDIYDYKSEEKSIRENWVQSISNNALIIGGGGLLNRGSFSLQMQLFQDLNAKGKKTVLWGVGHNSKNKSNFKAGIPYNIDTKKFGIVGVRDYNRNENWVPCVSCMHSIFNKKYASQQEIGIIYHKKTIKKKSLLQKLNTFPSTTNTKSLEDMIHFIGKTETIITDSYHAMYWATLLEKKVLCVPNSSKFFEFKYPPIITSFSEFERDIKKAKSYTGVLEDCKEKNILFAKKVSNYLNS